jgi:hypothetical protein
VKHNQQFTHHQQRIINQSKYVSIGLGVFSAVLFRAYGFANFWVWFFLIALETIVIVWTVQSLGRPVVLPNLQVKQDPDLKRQLIRMCGGDQALAERLIGFEHGNCKAAIEKLTRDRH